MTELPRGWRKVRFGEVLKVKYGKAIDKSQRLDSAKFPVVGSAGVMTYTRTPLTSEPTIVIGRKGNVGSIQIFKEGCYPIDTTYYMPTSSEFNIDFLTYLLTALELVKLDSSTATPSLRREDLENVSLVIPPIQEQYKIVELLEDHLSRLDAALADVKQARIKSAQFRQSLLNSVFYGNKFDSVHLGTCIDLIMGQAPPGITCNKNGEGTPFVKVGEFAKLYPTIKEWTLKPLRLAKAGDVLICVVGATVGKINLGIDCAIGRSVAAIRPKNTLLQKYLYYFLELKMLEIRGQSKGSAQGVITKDYINSIQIPLPDLKVQQDVLDLLESNFSQIEKSVEVSYIIEHESFSLRRSLLQAAFTGQLAKEVASV